MRRIALHLYGLFAAVGIYLVISAQIRIIPGFNASRVVGTITVAHGGTGLATLTAHALYVGNGTTAPTALAVGSTGQVLVGASGADAAWSAAPTLTSITAAVHASSGTGTSVANVGANSCGTSAASIAGNQTNGVITVGATAGTQCRVTFSTAAPTARDCVVTDSTTTVATRATYVDTTHTDFLGAFVAADTVTYLCFVR